MGEQVGTWTCACGEEHDAVFDQCWSCGATRGDAVTPPPPQAPSMKRAYCLGCKYPLRDLKTPQCPECGRPFDPHRTESYGIKGVFEQRCYDVLRHPDGPRYAAVKVGFSWPAFFFGPIWAFAKARWVIGLVLVACWFSVRLTNTGVVYLLGIVVAGLIGNELRVRALRRGGWERVEVTPARTAREAVTKVVDEETADRTCRLGVELWRVAVATAVFLAMATALEVAWWQWAVDQPSIIDDGLELRARGAITELGGSVSDPRHVVTTSASYANAGVLDDDVRWVRHFPQLQWLDLSGNPSVTDAALAHVAGNPVLTEVNIAGTSIRGDGFRELAHLPIMSVVMDRDQLDATMLDAVASLFGDGWYVLGTTKGHVSVMRTRPPQSKNLAFYEIDVTDAMLAVVARNTARVTALYAPGSSITDAGLAHLHGLPLQHVDLTDTGVTLAGVLDLMAAERTELRFVSVRNGEIRWTRKFLSLTGRFVDDRGLVHLAGMDGLPPTIVLQRTAVTEAAVAALREERPDLNVRH
ncbi:MAG: DUF2628 domain-containing protein [Planctomycetota bacterium]|jgi:hypothetical protein